MPHLQGGSWKNTVLLWSLSPCDFFFLGKKEKGLGCLYGFIVGCIQNWLGLHLSLKKGGERINIYAFEYDYSPSKEANFG